MGKKERNYLQYVCYAVATFASQDSDNKVIRLISSDAVGGVTQLLAAPLNNALRRCCCLLTLAAITCSTLVFGNNANLNVLLNQLNIEI